MASTAGDGDWTSSREESDMSEYLILSLDGDKEVKHRLVDASLGRAFCSEIGGAAHIEIE